MKLSVSGTVHCQAAMRRVLKRIWPSELSGEEWIVYAYRLASWGVGSLFFVLNGVEMPLRVRVLLIMALLWETFIVLDVYGESRTNSRRVKVLVVLETLGVAFVLIPTGGIESPFIWFALNPVLSATASHLRLWYSWGSLGFLLSTAISSYGTLFLKGQATWHFILHHYMNLILLFTLITIAIQLYSAFARKLKLKSDELRQRQLELQRTNRYLEISNMQARDSMREIVALYQAVQTVTAEDDLTALEQLIADFTAQLTRVKKSFVWMWIDEDHPATLKTHTDKPEPKLYLELLDLWHSLGGGNHTVRTELCGTLYEVVMVQSSSTRYGLIGREVRRSRLDLDLQDDIDVEDVRPMKLLADLYAIVLERRTVEHNSRQLLLIEEQHRIADEMHDHVSQRLFSLVYGIHALQKSYSKLPAEQIQHQLDMMKQTAQMATQEFRRTVYSLSRRRRTDASFVEQLTQYLEGIRQLNGIEVTMDLGDADQWLTPVMKAAVIRIVAEASGNAVRHGHCRRLLVAMDVDEGSLVLRIEDNGRGFDLSALTHRKVTGLGLQNMRNTAASFGGRFDIESHPRQGTRVTVTIPQFANGKASVDRVTHHRGMQI